MPLHCEKCGRTHLSTYPCQKGSVMPSDQKPPAGFHLIEIYTNGAEFVICEQPGFRVSSDDKSHNCDALGCSSLSHVFARGNDLEKLLSRWEA